MSRMNNSVLNHKFYSLCVIASLFSAGFTHADLSETVAKACARWLEPDKPNAPIAPSESPEYLEYQNFRAHHPSALPPAAPFSNRATPAELKFSFYFWWYPGNVFGPLMVPQHRSLALHLVKGGKLADHLIPTPEERAEEAARRERNPILETPPPVPLNAEPSIPTSRSALADSLPDPLDTSPTKEDATSSPPTTSPISSDPTGTMGGDGTSGF